MSLALGSRAIVQSSWSYFSGQHGEVVGFDDFGCPTVRLDGERRALPFDWTCLVADEEPVSETTAGGAT